MNFIVTGLPDWSDNNCAHYVRSGGEIIQRVRPVRRYS